jgi:natural product precursor
MKKLGKIHFRTIEEGLSESEMKFVVGGNYGYGYGGISLCNEDEYFDWYYLRCMKKSTNTGKIDACAGLQAGDKCV